MNEFVIQNPAWLYALLLIPLVIIWHWKYASKHAAVFVFPASSGSGNRSYLNPTSVFLTLYLIAFAFVVLALSDVCRKSVKTGFRMKSDTDIVLALDVSGSMMMEDLKPNRLEALKHVISNFIATRKDDRLGMVLYAGESINASPLTRNTFFLINQLNQLEMETLEDGTAIGLGLGSAVNVLKLSKAKSKVVILLTDGENNAGFIDPITASLLAKRHHIKVYTVGVGTNGVAPFPIRDFSGKKVYQYIPVKLDEPMLRAIARNTGGLYFRAQDTRGLQAVYKAINKQESYKREAFREISYISIYRALLVIAICLVLTAELLRLTVLKVFGE